MPFYESVGTKTLSNNKLLKIISYQIKQLQILFHF